MHHGPRFARDLGEDCKPLARTTQLAVQRIHDETLVYDLATDRIHCLSPTAARVFALADGATSVVAMADRLAAEGIDVEDFSFALASLVDLGLVDLGLVDPAGVDAASSPRALTRPRVVSADLAPSADGTLALVDGTSIESPRSTLQRRAGISRRAWLQRAGVAAAVTTLVTPSAAVAASCLSTGKACSSNGECCSNVCVPLQGLCL